MSQLTRGQNSRVLYIEKKSGHSHDGAARIGRVRFSRTGRTLYYRDLELRSLKGGGGSGNYYDVATGDEYWVSGVKQRGTNRHEAGSGDIVVDDDVREEYEQLLQLA